MKALFLSFLIHALIFSIFTFNFPVKPIPHKPKIIFLGSILKKNIITRPYKNKTNILKSKNFINKKLEKNTSLFQTTTSPKPDLSKSINKNKKITQKMYFEIPNKKQNDKKTEKIDTILEKSVYIPFKLYKSKNIFSK